METIQIDYDPEKITYSQLLQVFFSSHNPTWPSPIRQYASAVMVHDEEQERLATEAIKDASERYGKKISTQLLPYAGFTRAEDYHQKYYLRNTVALMNQYKNRFPSEESFTDSTAVARVNGYIGGNGTKEQLEREKEELGVSGEAVEALKGILVKAGK
jgi:peptide methionine sulfoxide reductase MsrA